MIGGGIAGLAAAFFLREQAREILVFEASDRIGGKLAVADVAGISTDTGAEALLARRPEAIGLVEAIGLEETLVSPGTTSAAIWSRGEFHPLPRRQFMGVPGDFDDLERTGILSAAGMARARQDAVLPAASRTGDVAVARYVGARFGSEVVNRLVEPLLGGVYAGRPETLSFEATLNALARISGEHASLAEAVGTLLPPSPPPGSSPARPPMFTTLASGLGSLPGPLAAASGATVRTGASVRALARTRAGWRLTIGPADAAEVCETDAVVLAVPAGPAGRLLATVPGAAAAAAALGEIEYASMAVVTLAYPATAFPGPLTGSGYLVPAVDGRPVKAATFSTVKWPHLADGALHVVRCSVGRADDDSVLRRDDRELTALAIADLAAATGVTGAPADTRVTRWDGGLPQYTVGHLDRVGRIRDGAARLPGLAVCGAAYDGVGVPACIGSARSAADQVGAYLREHRSGGGANAGE